MLARVARLRPRLRLALAVAYALAMVLVAASHRPLAATPVERALILAAYNLPGVETDFCLPGLGEHSRLDTPCDGCVLVAVPGLAAVAAALPPPPLLHAVTEGRGDVAARPAPERHRPHPRGPPRAA
jgi:hypothetical protein